MVPIKRLISKQLGELLIEKGAISKAQFDKALGIQREKGGLIGQILVALGYVTEEDIAQALTVQYGFPYLGLSDYKISADVVKLIPENVARQYNVIAVDRIGQTITIAMSNPLNMQAVEDVETITKMKAEVVVSTTTDIDKAIREYYPKRGGRR